VEKRTQYYFSDQDRFYKKDEGLTIIEVLIALVILSVGVLAVAKLQIETTKHTTRANILTQATMLAQTRMDELKNFENFADLDLEHARVENIDASGSPGGIFTRTTTVVPLPAPISGLAREISVSVAWQSPWRGHRQIVLNSVTQGGGI
jgi:prepilin-type N-terminal cleavage/methylation domain-containing protein